MGIALIVIGAVILFVLAVPDEAARATRAVIDGARPLGERADGLEWVTGIAEPGPVTIEAPVSGAPAVWVGLSVAEESSTDADAGFSHKGEARSRQAFILRREGGERVLVEPADAAPEAAPDRCQKTGPVTSDPARLTLFLADHGGALARADDGFTRRRSYEENRVEPGDALLVMGRASAGGTEDGPFRGSEALPRIVAHVVSRRSHAALVAAQKRFRIGWAIVGLALELVGVALLWASR